MLGICSGFLFIYRAPNALQSAHITPFRWAGQLAFNSKIDAVLTLARGCFAAAALDPASMAIVTCNYLSATSTLHVSYAWAPPEVEKGSAYRPSWSEIDVFGVVQALQRRRETWDEYFVEQKPRDCHPIEHNGDNGS